MNGNIKAMLAALNCANQAAHLAISESEGKASNETLDLIYAALDLIEKARRSAKQDSTNLVKEGVL